MESASKDVVELHLYDAAADKTFTLLVSQENFNKANKDITFAQSLLQSAIVMQGNNLPSVNSTESHYSGSLDLQLPQSSLTKERNTEDTRDASENHLNQRHVWSYNGTVALIHSMETHMDELENPKKRKFVFTNVSNDLLSAGFEFDTETCSNKWKTLVRSYKQTKDNRNKTGRAPSRFMFFDEMDNILGDKPSNKCSHTLESSNSVAPTSSSSNLVPTTSSSRNLVAPTSSKDESTDSDSNKENSVKVRKTREKKNNLCVKLREEEYKRREERHREKVELTKKKIDIEERKVELLEMLLKKS